MSTNGARAFETDMRGVLEVLVPPVLLGSVVDDVVPVDRGVDFGVEEVIVDALRPDDVVVVGETVALRTETACDVRTRPSRCATGASARTPVDAAVGEAATAATVAREATADAATVERRTSRDDDVTMGKLPFHPLPDV
ncbi:hypothetical protein [uncultured Williamsia sp.]|uniref:hypothetical protein n=1 Tax=uncultured Williamsia sp. TaxID=259311 RepID=UPI002621AD88|nr:hypothetical protein [uncultured Williamsia sp.]